MASEVASAFVSLIPSAKGFRAGIQKQISGDLDSTGRAGGKKLGSGMVAGFGSSIKGIAGPLAAAFAGVAVFDFFKDAVAQASDLAESGNKLSAIFGPAAKQIEAFADRGATALGLNAVAARDAAATFGIFGKAAGLSGKDLVGFSSDLTTLATDLASFFNTDPSQAVEAIGAALRGESEPIRSFGVLLDEATLKARAMQMGLAKASADQTKIASASLAASRAQRAYTKAVKEHGPGSRQAAEAEQALGIAKARLEKATQGTIPPLTQQQKVLAAQAEIMAQTKDAQGDFARTSGGLANQQRILSASFDDLKGKIGTGLLPAVTGVVSGINKLIPQVSTAVGPLVDQMAAKIGPAMQQIGAAAGPALQQLFATLQKVGTAIGPVFQSIASSVGPVITGLVGVFQQMVTTFGPAIISLFQRVAAVVGPAIKEIATLFTTQFLPAFKAFLPVVKPVFDFIVKFFGDIIIGALKGAINVIKGVLNILTGIFRTVAAVFKGDWSAAWNGVKQIFSGAWQAIKGIVQVALNVGVLGIIRKGFLLIKGVVQLGWNALRGLFMGGLNAIRGILGRLPGIFTGILNRVWQGAKSIGVNIVRGLINGVKSLAGAVKDAILNLLPGPLKKFANLLGISSPSKVFARFGANIGEGLVRGVDHQRAAVEESVARLARTARVQGSMIGTGAAGGRTLTVINNYPRPETASDGLAMGLRRAQFVGAW